MWMVDFGNCDVRGKKKKQRRACDKKNKNKINNRWEAVITVQG